MTLRESTAFRPSLSIVNLAAASHAAPVARFAVVPNGMTAHMKTQRKPKMPLSVLFTREKPYNCTTVSGHAKA